MNPAFRSAPQRSVLAIAALVALAVPQVLPAPALAQTDTTQGSDAQPAVPLNLDLLVAAFNALSQDDRSAVQEEMQIGGFYDGPLDGSDSDSTREGLRMTVQQVFSNGYAGPAIDMTTAEGARTFLAAVVSGEMSKWIYGEGEEMDG